MSSATDTNATDQAPKATPSTIVSKTIFDLKTFGDVNIGIEFTPSPAFTSITEAMAFYGNDESKVLAALNADKFSVEREAIKNSPLSAWHTFSDDEETTLNGPADVVPVNEKLVNDLVLNIAKQHYGFVKGAGAEKNRAAKGKALMFISSTPELRGYLTIMSGAAPVPEVPATDTTAVA